MSKNIIKDMLDIELVDSSILEEFQKGDVIITEGEPSNETMYFVVSGSLSVFQKRNNSLEEINVVEEGEFFGEIALISNQPRSATVIVKSQTAKLILFNKEKFLKQTKSNPGLMFAILRATVARIFKAELEFEKLLKHIKSFNPLLISKLNQNKVRVTNLKVVDFLHKHKTQSFNKGDKILTEGKFSSGYIYFISHGKVRCLKKIHEKNYHITDFEEGYFFGEISFFTGARNFSTFYALTDLIVVPIDKKVFLDIVLISPEIVIQELKSFIWKLMNTEKAIQLLKNQLESKPQQSQSDIRRFKQGEIIIAEGEPSNDTMYFVLKGELNVYKNRGSNKELINLLYKGDFFGELSLISNQPRTATIEVKSESAELILFSKKKFIEQTRENPGLMLAILKATIARLLRAETSLDKVIRRYPLLDTNLQIKLDQSRVENINIFQYVHNVYIANLMKGEKIYSENEASNGQMYFLLEGQLSVRKRIENRVFKITTLEKGDFFGEVSIVSNIPRYNSIYVSSDRAKVASLNLDILMKIIHLNPAFLLSLLRTVIWKLIIMENAVTKLNIEYEMYESKLEKK